MVGVPVGAVIYQEFARCASDSFFTPPDDIENGQYGAAIVYCDQPSEPWSELWPSMRTRY